MLELLVDVLSVDLELDSEDFEAPESPSLALDALPLERPFADDDERESVMYQPLPLKTMPTG